MVAIGGDGGGGVPFPNIIPKGSSTLSPPVVGLAWLLLVAPVVVPP